MPSASSLGISLRSALALAAALTLSACAPTPPKTTLPATSGLSKTAEPPANRRLHSLKELRDAGVVKQDLDYSCGAASLATLLRFYFGDPVSERVLLHDMLQPLSPADRADRIAYGFTLLDLREAAVRRGYVAEGVELDLPALTQLGGPVLLHLIVQGQRHFAVFRGVQGDRIFLADPRRGNVRMDVWRFKNQWTGVALALGREGQEAPAHHALRVRPTEAKTPELLSARHGLF